MPRPDTYACPIPLKYAKPLPLTCKSIPPPISIPSFIPTYIFPCILLHSILILITIPIPNFFFFLFSSNTFFMKKSPLSPAGSDQQAVEIMAKQHPNVESDSIQPPAESRRKQKVEETEEGDGRAEVTGRERLKRHQVEVAGQVWIPDIWGQEKLLKDWIDCSAFDASVMNATIMSARAALAAEGRRAHAAALRIENSC